MCSAAALTYLDTDSRAASFNMGCVEIAETREITEKTVDLQETQRRRERSEACRAAFGPPPRTRGAWR
jgi:hypothetical protein